MYVCMYMHEFNKKIFRVASSAVASLNTSFQLVYLIILAIFMQTRQFILTNSRNISFSFTLLFLLFSFSFLFFFFYFHTFLLSLSLSYLHSEWLLRPLCHDLKIPNELDDVDAIYKTQREWVLVFPTSTTQLIILFMVGTFI